MDSPRKKSHRPNRPRLASARRIAAWFLPQGLALVSIAAGPKCGSGSRRTAVCAACCEATPAEGATALKYARETLDDDRQRRVAAADADARKKLLKDEREAEAVVELLKRHGATE